jgi:hypothetical protein
MYLGQDRSNNPALATYLHWLQKTHPGVKANLYGIEAWAAGQLFVQGLKTIGPHPTRSKLLKALHDVTTFTANGLLPTSDPGQSGPPVCIVMVGVSGSHFTRLDPKTKGFECNGKYHRISLAQAANGS